MEDLTIVAKICKLPKIVVVPLENIYKLDLVKPLNNRINRNQVHLMYWSNDHKKKPNFNLPISQQFDNSVESCYNVKLHKVFSKCLLFQK